MIIGIIQTNFSQFGILQFLQRSPTPQTSNWTQARLWPCGRGDLSTPSFGSQLNPISTRGADYAHSIYWCPHQILKATGAPVRDMCFVIRNIKKLFHETAEVQKSSGFETQGSFKYILRQHVFDPLQAHPPYQQTSAFFHTLHKHNVSNTSLPATQPPTHPNIYVFS